MLYLLCNIAVLPRPRISAAHTGNVRLLPISTNAVRGGEEEEEECRKCRIRGQGEAKPQFDCRNEKVELQQSECVSRTSFSPLTTFRIEARSAPTDNILQRAISHVTSTPSYPVGMIREFTLWWHHSEQPYLETPHTMVPSSPTV